MCSRRSGGQLWYRVKWLNVRKGDWVVEDIVPKEMQREVLCKVHNGRKSQEKEEKAFEADR